MRFMFAVILKGREATVHEFGSEDGINFRAKRGTSPPHPLRKINNGVVLTQLRNAVSCPIGVWSDVDRHQEFWTASREVADAVALTATRFAKPQWAACIDTPL